MKSRPVSNRQPASRPANPRLPNYPLLVISSVALAGWTVFLVLIALRVV